MRKIIIYILTILLFSSCDFTSAEEYFNQAYVLENKGEFEKAILILDKAIDKNPNFRPALINRGADKSYLGDKKGAIEDYKRILKFDIDNTLALYNIGNNYSALKEHEKSIYYFSLSLKTKGALESFAGSHGILTLHTIYDSKPFDNDTDYQLHDYEIYYARGIEYLAVEQFENAISDFDKSIKVNYKKNECYNLTGKAYIGKNDSITACENFFKTAKIGDAEGKQLLRKYYVKR
jgi:tetratricopeptide (TPR) repeat protein